MNDGVKKLKLVGFGETLQSTLSKFHETKEPISLNNCTIKKARNSTDTEIIISDYTEISKSDKSFNITDWTGLGPTDDILTVEQLKQIQDLATYQKVLIPAAKVVHVEEPTYLDDGRKCQNIVIGDLTATTRLTLWQQHVDTVLPQKTYKFTNMTVNSFENKNYLYTSKTDASIDPLDIDISYLFE